MRVCAWVWVGMSACMHTHSRGGGRWKPGLEHTLSCLCEGAHDDACEPVGPVWGLCVNSAPPSPRPARCFHLPSPGPTAPWAAAEPLGSILAVWPRFLLQLHRLSLQTVSAGPSQGRHLPQRLLVLGASRPAVSVLGSPWSRTHFRPFLCRILLVTLCTLAALALAYWRVS